MSKNQPQKLSKRETMRVERKKQQQRQRLIIVGSIVVAVIVIAGLIVAPTIQRANAPVGEFVRVTPQTWPDPDGVRLGDPNAAVTIDIFEDFKCSACQAYHQSIEPQVLSELVETGRVHYIFHNYPFLDDSSNVKDSDKAANAAMCAAEQGKFWDYKSILFSNFNGIPGEFSDNRLIAFADSLSLDNTQFTECYKDRKYQVDIDADLALGEQWNVTGTPSVYVNGQILTPGQVPGFVDIEQAVTAAESGG